MSRVISQTATDLAKAGYDAVMRGDLARMRDSLGMTRNAQAHLLGVDGESLRRWESLERGMNVATATRIGEWMWGARMALESVSNVATHELVPITTAARKLGIAESDLEAACDRGEYEFVRLGVLGTFIYRENQV
jgi:DNA-binding XRE family transcriptional regulator